MSDTFRIIKSRGKFTEELRGAPEFSNRLEAEKWAAAYQKRRDNDFPRGVATIEVTTIHHPGED